jgi:hypothetical protein
MVSSKNGTGKTGYPLGENEIGTQSKLKVSI